ncbi:MAG: hypothetical protein MJZ46_05930, partial [Bacteroidales bacterium]|nr:hypothetical protein [Bacteroidales bacterium]
NQALTVDLLDKISVSGEHEISYIITICFLGDDRNLFLYPALTLINTRYNIITILMVTSLQKFIWKMILSKERLDIIRKTYY